MFPEEAGFFSDDDFQYFLFIYCSHLRCKEHLAELALQLDDDYRYLNSMHLFAIPAVDSYWWLTKDEYSQERQSGILTGNKEYAEFIVQFLKCFVAALKRIYSERVLAENMSERLTHTAFKKSKATENDIIEAMKELHAFSKS